MNFEPNYLPKDGLVTYHENFYTKLECNEFYSTLMKNVDWLQQPIKLFGKRIMQPRLTAFYSDDEIDYKYSGIRMRSNSWIQPLIEVKSRIENFSSFTFNSALLNLYRDGNDSMGWHRDNEKELGLDPDIASVSFGAERIISFRHLTDKTDKILINLAAGSLLLMSGKTQNYWYHCIPKTKKIISPRINITFRNIQK
jgi:alkylated DNA repair dioxygenase AlkB